MFFEFLIASFLGILAGIFTGLTPGIHINLVSLLVVSSAAYLSNIFSFASLGVFIVSMAITHTFLDTLPAIFLGAPESETALSVLPGHKLLLKGMGYEAVKLTIIGSLMSLLTALFLFPLFIFLVPRIYEGIRVYIGYFLIAIMAYMIFMENSNDKKFWSLFVFMASGILGLIVLTMPNLGQPLFPLLSGLFGISMLIVSLMQKTEIPKQSITDQIKISKKESVKAIGAATLTGSFVSFFPGLGPAQAAVIGSQIVGSLENYAFLILVGGINTVNMAVSLVSLYTIEKARNGAVLAIMELLHSIDFNILLLFIGAMLLAGGVSTFLALYLARFFVKIIERVNYSLMCIIVIIFISMLVLYFSSWIGFLILAVSASVGIIPNLVNVKRSHSMGCLILPVILFFIL